MERPPQKLARSGLRLVPPDEVDENLAVERAQMHASHKSLSWKQYVRNLDFFLAVELGFEKVVGIDCLPWGR